VKRAPRGSRLDLPLQARQEGVREVQSPKTYKNLKPGKHRFQVKARDTRGLLVPSPAIKKVTIKG
jgi:hypothetical protein